MDAYTDFANVYDTFMDETPYDVWGDFVVELLNKYGVTKPVKNAGCPTCSNDEANNTDDNEIPEQSANDKVQNENECVICEYTTEEDTEQALEEEKNLIVELGCGTGSFTLNMAKRGYDIIGIDMSPDMLDIARKKTAAEKNPQGRKVYKVHKYKKSATSKAARSAQGKGRRKKR